MEHEAQLLSGKIWSDPFNSMAESVTIIRWALDILIFNYTERSLDVRICQIWSDL